MVALTNPHRYPSCPWWLHEAAICTEDGHPAAAQAAYNQAAANASTDLERETATRLRELASQME